MTAEKFSTSHEDVLWRAAERLLAWGFAPTEVARQLGRSTSWVDQVDHERIPQSAGPGDAHGAEGILRDTFGA